MGVLVKNTNLSNKHGGNNSLLVQMKYDTATSKFVAATEDDAFGDDAGSVQELGNISESDFRRNDDGSWSLKVKILEQNLIRHNMLELLCPPGLDEAEDDQEFMEDNITYVGSKGAAFNSAKPVFAIFHALAPLGGKKRVRHAFVQAKAAGGHIGSKAKQRNYIEVEFYTVDANGSLAVAAPDHDAVDGITIPALAAPYQYGKLLEEA